MHNGKHKNWFERLGCAVSEVVAETMAHPFAQVGVIVVCALWWAVGLPTDILTATLSILAITLTQMVLNNQAEREVDSHRRDVAMHAKLDELISATKRARNEFVGVEEREEDEIVQLKEEVKEALEEADVSDPETRETAAEAVEAAAEEMKHDLRRKQEGATKPRKTAALAKR
jgi:low affinity Fe/Cu permease